MEDKKKFRNETNIDNNEIEKEIKNEFGKEPSEIYDEKAKGNQVRSRDKWVEFGEK